MSGHKTGEMSSVEPGENSPSSPQARINRLHFLYKVIEDTQATIRFLDTKAAFCVTLLSGMTAVILQRATSTFAHRILLSLFLCAVILALLVCLRVIFPTIKPSGDFGKAAPKFYIGHNKAHHWLLHTIANPVDDVLSETHRSYMAAVEAADDHTLISALTDAALTLALIRQLKSDRLHAAMFSLMVAVFLFAIVVMTS